MWLILVVLVGIGIYFMVQNSRTKGSGGIETPLDVLKKRYANGGIDKEEFERKRKDLGS